MALRASSSTVVKVLGSEMWPVQGAVGDLLQLALAEVSPQTWDTAFDLSDLSWLPKLIPIEVPRTYSISNYTNELLPSTVDLTVTRSEYKLADVLDSGQSATIRYGVSSGCFNPDPSHSEDMFDDEEYLIGISRPLNFQLPTTMAGPVAMFAGGSGIAPFRGFWQNRAQTSVGRNILFLGVQSRERFSYEHELREYVRSGHMELHTAFSRDQHGLVYDATSRELVEKQIAPRYLDTVIIEQGRTVCDMVISKSQGGLGGHLYICGSISMYETIMSGIRQALYKNWTSTKDSADSLLAKAFAERRFMLDIFMTPKPISYTTPQIPISQLALHTGHRKGTRMYIGVHGGVYDISDFLPIHPGGTLIAQASAGLDASKTFNDVAHTTNPEVMSLLSKYFIGHLATKPAFRSSEICTLYDLWYQYLRNCVESLTTLYFEVNYIQEDARTWFQGDLFNMGGVRKFYQFQSRLMQNGFSTLFGAKLQELHLKLTFGLVNSGTPDMRVPDVIGIITRTLSSRAAATASKEIAHIGEFVCNSQDAQFQENGILRYARTVTELDVQFLEEVRGDICLGMDAFDVVNSMESASPSGSSDKQKLMSLSKYLLSVLERVAQRLETFYARLARESVYRPELEKNPARTRWNVLKQKIWDGSFFVLTEEAAFTFTGSSMDAANKPYRSTRHADQDVFFAQVVSQAKTAVDDNNHYLTRPQKAHHGSDSDSGRSQPRLADSHTARAAPSAKAPSSYEVHESLRALKSMSTFMDSNMQSIKRLSQLPSNLSFEHIMATYGRTNKQPHVPSAAATLRAETLDAKPLRLTSHQHDQSRSSNHSSRPSPSSTTPPESVLSSGENSASRDVLWLRRRPTNTSISSATGLPPTPSPSVQSHKSFVGRPAQPQSKPLTSVATAMSPSTMPLPLTLARRSRSESRTRSELGARLNHRTDTYASSENVSGRPGPAVKGGGGGPLVRRQLSMFPPNNSRTVGTDVVAPLYLVK
jgi:cytochrome b involved in lipid metabolism